jgi:hypothetical protein
MRHVFPQGRMQRRFSNPVIYASSIFQSICLSASIVWVPVLGEYGSSPGGMQDTEKTRVDT